MTGETSAWAVGSGGVILHYRNGGWTLITSPSSANLTALAMTSETTGWAVGTDIVQYSAGSWVKAANPFDNSGRGLNGISMVSSSEGWAVGDDGIILHYQNGVWSSYQ